jgi:hypothetical protein
VFFKAHRADDARYGRLAQLLGQLETHLILWHAKYAAWIPNNPEHALVYMADESKHGLGFPSGIDEEVAHHLGLKPPAVSQELCCRSTYGGLRITSASRFGARDLREDLLN